MGRYGNQISVARLRKSENCTRDIIRYNDRRSQKNGLIGEFTGGNQAIKDGLGRAWGDRENWSPAMKQNAAPFSDPRIWEFINRCRQAAR